MTDLIRRWVPDILGRGAGRPGDNRLFWRFEFFAMGCDLTYEIHFKESIEEWDAATVKKATDRDLAETQERLEFLYLYGESDSKDSGGVCIVDLYVAGCSGDEAIRDVMTVFWNLYGVPMKYRLYTRGNKPWVDFTGTPPSTSDEEPLEGSDSSSESSDSNSN